MPKKVQLTIGGKPVGTSQIAPYSHTAGLQTVRSVDGRVRGVLYTVPKYELRFKNGGAYEVIRFGLQNRGQLPPPLTRPCDAGLSQGRTCHPTWVPSYSPHSFQGDSRPGAWRLIPKKGFLIHEGPDTTAGQFGGSLGCIEVLDGRWGDFLSELEKLAGTTSDKVGKAGLLQVTIEPAVYPTAALVRPY